MEATANNTPYPASHDGLELHPWFNHVNDAVIVTNASWQIVQWNRAAEELYGWSRGDVIGRNTSDVFARMRYLNGGSRPATLSALQEQGFWRGEVVHPTRDGRELMIEGSIRTIYDAQGATTGYITINRDITARYQAEQALRSSEERFRAIIENGSEGLLLVGTDRRALYVSPTITALLGYPVDQFATLSAHELSHPDDLPTLDRFIAMLTGSAGASGRITTRVRHADGRWRWMEQSGTNQTHNPAIGAIIISYRDATDRMLAEQARSASEARYRTLVQHFPNGAVLLFDHDLRYILAAGQALAPLGYSSQKLEGKTLSEVVPPEGRALLEPLYQAALAGQPQSYDLTVRGRHYATQVHPITGADGEIQGGMVVSQDITDRVRAGQALQRTADRLTALHAIDRAILDLHTPATIANTVIARIRELIPCQHVSVILYHGDGQVSQQFSSEGPSAARLPTDIWPAPIARDHWPRFQQGDPWVDSDVQAPVYDGLMTKLILAKQIRSLLSIPLLAQWQLIGTLSLAATAPGAFTDEHVAIAQELGDTLAVALHNARLVESLQQELAARERAEAALIAEHARVIRLKNEFMATMSHELRTPLAAVLGRAELLLDGIYGPLNERQSAAMRTVEQSGRSLLALINDILDYSRFEAGQIALDLAPTMVSSVCRDSVRAVAQSALHKHIVLTSTLDSAVMAIQADAKRLQQVLVNLLSNAIKFTPEGGEVGLEVRGDAEREQVTFTIWDTGIGIAAEDFPRLFQPFTQLDSRLSRQYEGTGLGLALVRRLIEAHGGSVAVESAPGQGSRFSATLLWAPGPAALPGPPAAEPEPRAPAAGSQAREGRAILLVEDRESDIDVLHDLLTSQGYQLLVARDGNAGLALARERQPDLVLMDIQLPGMSGVAAIQALRGDERMRHIPIIALTALVMPGDRERCLQAGADEYLAKPASGPALLAAIARLIDRR
jgi:PAS domain S-box-containing protein